MRLLFDQNISFRIIKKIDDIFTESEQTIRISLDKASDFDIWKHAKSNNFCIVTFDSDSSTNPIAEILKINHSIIKEFLVSHEVAYLELA